MRLLLHGVTALLSIACTTAALPDLPDGLVYATNGSGVFGYKNTPKLPWCDYLVHDPDRPAPVRIDPGAAPLPAPVPSDAIVLFRGQDLSQWTPNQWRVENGEIVTGVGSLATKEKFGDIQLHLEWLAPDDGHDQR